MNDEDESYEQEGWWTKAVVALIVAALVWVALNVALSFLVTSNKSASSQASAALRSTQTSTRPFDAALSLWVASAGNRSAFEYGTALIGGSKQPCAKAIMQRSSTAERYVFPMPAYRNDHYVARWACSTDAVWSSRGASSVITTAVPDASVKRIP